MATSTRADDDGDMMVVVGSCKTKRDAGWLQNQAPMFSSSMCTRLRPRLHGETKRNPLGVSAVQGSAASRFLAQEELRVMRLSGPPPAIWSPCSKCGVTILGLKLGELKSHSIKFKFNPMLSRCPCWRRWGANPTPASPSRSSCLGRHRRDRGRDRMNGLESIDVGGGGAAVCGVTPLGPWT
jgi:hypothetical protein